MKNNKSINVGLEIGKGLLTVVLFFTLPAFFAPIFSRFITSSNFWTRNISYILLELIVFSVFVFIYRKRLKEDFKDFKLNYKVYLKKCIPIWIKSLLLMALANVLINSLITGGNIAVNEEVNRNIMLADPLYAIFGMVILGPMLEEIVFRFSFKKAFTNIWVYTIATGLFFAALHVSTSVQSFSEILTNWRQLLFIIPYGIVGCSFSYCYFKTDNIFTSGSLHLMHNALSVGLIILTQFI